MVKQRSRRLGRVMRWGVYACTTLVVFVFLASFIIVSGPGPFVLSGYRQDSESPNKATVYILWVNGGRVYFDLYGINVQFDPENSELAQVSPAHHGVELEPILHSYSEYDRWEMSEYSGRSWWSLFFIPQSEDKKYCDIEAPLIYPALTLILWSIAIFKKQRAFARFDRCSNCGYSLADLPTETCPECGGTINTSA